MVAIEGLSNIGSGDDRLANLGVKSGYNFQICHAVFLPFPAKKDTKKIT
jgi:hypothetical protein